MALSEFLQKKIDDRKKYNEMIFHTTQFTAVEEKYPGTKQTIQDYIGDSDYLRFGQAVCNTICDDYRSESPREFTQFFMDKIFHDLKMDPFYEEPVETYNRLIRESENTLV